MMVTLRCTYRCHHAGQVRVVGEEITAPALTAADLLATGGSR
jgi:hypothetical protein